MIEFNKCPNPTRLVPVVPKEKLILAQRRIVLKNKDGSIREDYMAEFPTFWSDQSCKVVADKYFRVVKGVKETSVCQIVNRVSANLAAWGIMDEYFMDDEEREVFWSNIETILYYQMGSFNSPVYFNVGVTDAPPQTSACFIMPVHDNMESIAEWYSTSMLVYKGGSGLGVNSSELRGSNEKLTVGGKSSGPISFIKSADCIGGSIASGGSVRRAAALTCMNVDHPNIMDFISMKSREEKKALTLLDAGYSGGMDGEAYSTVAFQNMNVSSQCPDAFMVCAENKADWNLINRRDGAVCATLNAHEMLWEMATLAHMCGDPGIQFSDATNLWNTCKNSGRIKASNPCVTGETLLQTSSGSVPIKELVDNNVTEILVHCCDPLTGQAFLRMGRLPRKTAEQQQIYKVTTSAPNLVGVLRCTKNHGFIDLAGKRIETHELKQGQQLRCFYRQASGITTVDSVIEDGVEDVYNITVDGYHTVCWNNLFTFNCGEFIFDVADGWGACNLASINPVAFDRACGGFQHVFSAVVHTLIFAMDILIDRSGWPHPKFGEAARDFRPLGLGYSNLGVWLLQQGLAYGSVEGRAKAASLTHDLTYYAYQTSGELARRKGAFKHYDKNKNCFADVLKMHAKPFVDADGVNKIPELGFRTLLDQYSDTGFRNAQVTLLAPTGTISFWMGCDSNGLEPLYSLIVYKEFVGGGFERILLPSVEGILRSMGYVTLADVPDDKVGIFQTAMNENERVTPLTPDGHIAMMAAVQPYISGAISKTINMPANSTVLDVYNAYLGAWKQGLKGITIYRDGSKRFQPLSSTLAKEETKKQFASDDLHALFLTLKSSEQKVFLDLISGIGTAKPTRRKLPSDRTSTTHSFQIANFKGTLHIGFYPDTKKVGEIFITASKSGTTINGLLDSWAICFSYALQYGVPLSVLTRKFSYQRFEPEGWTNNPNINHAYSIIDYIARLLETNYNDEKANERSWLNPSKAEETDVVKDSYGEPESCEFDAPLCNRCGTLTRRVGACHTCPSCGESTGCG